MDISYNGVTFSVVKVDEMSHTPIRSQDGTTYLWTEVKIAVQGIMNPAAMAYVIGGGGAPEATPATIPPITVAAIRHALEQPREQLLITSATGDPMNPTVTVLESPASGFRVDCDNGPVPGPCTISDFSGARTWTVRWSCTTYIHECPNEDNITNPLISNRYSQSDDVDEQFRSTRISRGIAKFRTDLLSVINLTADDFRAYVLPPVPFGFFPRRIHVTLVENQNALSWEVEHEERFYDLGDTAASRSFITKVVANYVNSTISTTEGIPGGQTLGQINIRVLGTKEASTWVMTQRAFALAAGKIPIGTPPPLGGPIPGWIQHVSVNQSLTDRDVTVNIVYRFVPPPQGIIGVVNLSPESLRIDSIFPAQGGVNPSPPWGGGTMGTSKLKLLVAALEDACSGAAEPPCNDIGAVGGQGVQCGPGPTISISSSDELPAYGTGISTPGQENPYNRYEMNTRYERQIHTLMAPIAQPRGSSSGSSNLQSSGNGPTAVFFKLAQPTTTVRVTWHAERVGAPCQIPDPNSGNANYVLLDSHITPIAPQRLPDGVTLVYACSGEYVFGAITAMGLNETLGMGVVPWVAGSFTDFQVTASDYTGGLIDGGGDNFA